MAHVIVEEVYEQGLSPEQAEREAREIDRTLEQNGGRWLRSYLASDKRREICEFEAPSTDVVRQAFDQAGVKIERIWEAEVSQA